MKKIILSGCMGTMGKVLANSIKQREDCTVVAGFDINTIEQKEFPVFNDLEKCSIDADVIIDFSHPSQLQNLLDYAKRTKTAIVIATTGITEEQVKSIHEYSKFVPIFFTANMSLGVNLLVELAKKATRVLGNQFDIEIVEKHHNQKIDSPSGTALMLADNIANEMTGATKYVFDRHNKREKRSKNEIGIHAIRGGTIVGEHDVIFAGRDEIITLSHVAMSKEIFATGAINAGLFISSKTTGLYNMSELI